MTICLDTSFLVDRFRGVDYTETFLGNVPGDVPVLVPTIVLHELYTGALRSSRGERIADVRRELAGTRFVGFDDAAAEEAADIRATLADQGTTINALDMLIAGIAREGNAEVIAVDRDYGRVPGLAVRDPREGNDENEDEP